MFTTENQPTKPLMISIDDGATVAEVFGAEAHRALYKSDKACRARSYGTALAMAKKAVAQLAVAARCAQPKRGPGRPRKNQEM